MGLPMKRAVILVGIVAIVVLVMALFLVPAIAAVDQVGNTVFGQPQICEMTDPRTGPPYGKLVATSVYTVESNSQEYPKMNVVMKCEAQIDDYDGPAFAESGSTTINKNCAIDFPDVSKARFTEKWHQTVSSSGYAVLSCHFNKQASGY